MAIETSLPPAVHRYLQEFELELKQFSGISPEEALSDAREFLMQDSAALSRSGETPNEIDYYQWIIDKYGTPSMVAQQYADHTDPFPAKSGYAPGWRICCTHCGRSAPLASIGAIRIGAKSVHKYTFGYCRGCSRLRFLRIIQDLDKPNLTERLDVHHTPDEMRAKLHKPLAVIVVIVSAVLLSVVMLFIVSIFAVGFFLGN